MRWNVQSPLVAALVRRRPPARVAAGAAALLLALLEVGCAAPPPGERAPEPPPGGARFGHAYEVVLSEAGPAAPEEPPALRGDTLTATVAYAGGAKTHRFALGHETRGDTARLWLRHDAAGDPDSTRLVDEVRVAVPPGALQAQTVVLLNPQGGEPFVLRWPQ